MTPSEPLQGAVHDRAACEAIAAALVASPYGAQVWVLSDEIYERLVYDGVEHVSFAALSTVNSRGEAVSMWPRTLTVNGFSKASV